MDYAAPVSFQLIPREEIVQLTKTRAGEKKLGEGFDTVKEGESLEAGLAASRASFILIGLPEDVGVLANAGVRGACTSWMPALQALLNMQSTPGLQGSEVLLLGALRIAEGWIAPAASQQELRDAVMAIDAVVAEVAEKVISTGKILLAVGGGHNNAYGLLRGGSRALGKPLHAINLDAHSDYRAPEGRHSGNPFRYAKSAGHLDRYAILGLHESYNPASVMADLHADSSIHYSTYEDIFVRAKKSWEEAVSEAIQHVSGGTPGVELDLDCIEGVLSSAATPCGISTAQARRYLHRCATELQPAYLHIAEGAMTLEDGRTDWRAPKLIAYLLTDFMRGSLAAR